MKSDLCLCLCSHAYLGETFAEGWKFVTREENGITGEENVTAVASSGHIGKSVKTGFIMERHILLQPAV